MIRLRAIVFQLCFFLNCLLVFLLVFESRLSLPVWLQVAGRMHPLILHFPIVLLVLSIVWEFFLVQRTQDLGKQIGAAFLLGTAFTSVAAALMGVFLAREEGYDPELLVGHKWGGVALSLLALSWYSLRNNIRNNRIGSGAIGIAGLGLVLFTGHQGAGLTHGADFIREPILAARKAEPVSLNDAIVFTHMVQPILEQKCTGCHKPGKAKGNLVMTDMAGLVKGGKNGALWDSTEEDYGLMLRRVHLPMEQKKHMPPKGKPQLTEEELAILTQWVKCGANFTVKVADLPEQDTLRLMAVNRFAAEGTDNFQFASAPESKINDLSNNYRIITSVAIGSPALRVAFYSPAQFQGKHLEELVALKDQIVELNLVRMPVTDADLSAIGKLQQLRKLNLSFTQVTDQGLMQLATLKELKALSLSGTRAGKQLEQLLPRLVKLKQLQLWQTGLEPAVLKNLQKRFSQIQIVGGYNAEQVVLQLNPPVFDHEASIMQGTAPLRLKHFIEGVDIRYTLDGSEPDSVQSPRFDGRQTIDRTMMVKVKAFKKGWLSSPTSERLFFRAGIIPDSIKLLQKPDKDYTAELGRTLMDAKKGSSNFRDGLWLGYKETPMEAVVYFGKPVPIRSVEISSLVNTPSYIMPPRVVEIWGGNNLQQLRKIKTLSPKQPLKEEGNLMQRLQLEFPPETLQYLKVVVLPVKALPSWHPGKGTKGWVFMDELVFN